MLYADMNHDKYYLCVFENGEEWKYEGELPIPANTTARERNTQLTCILYGGENPYGEFVPEICYDSKGNRDDGLLLYQMLSRAVNSRDAGVAGMAAYSLKKILEEMKDAT